MPDDAATQALNAAIANANAAEARGDHAGCAAAATAALKLKEAAYHPSAPTNPVDAKGATQRLAALGKDGDWCAKLFAGDGAARAEFDRLNKLVADADPIDRALSGAVPGPWEAETNSGAEAGLRDQISFVADARLAAIPDDNLRAILSPGAPTPEDNAWARAHLTALYRQYLNVPLAQWPPAAVRALHEFARLADATPVKL
jgi:hypothetical protein